jgi:hypothetical protein
MKYITFILLWLILSSNILANESFEEDFNRLFTTATERKKLDLAREQGRLFKKSSITEIDSTHTENQPVTKSSPMKVSGIILRADGKAQVWISGQPLYRSLKQLNADKKVSSDLRVPLSGKSISLKPGQVLLNGKAKESYYFVTRSSVSSQAIIETRPTTSSSSLSAASSSVSSQADENAQTKKP